MNSIDGKLLVHLEAFTRSFIPFFRSGVLEGSIVYGCDRELEVLLATAFFGSRIVPDMVLDDIGIQLRLVLEMEMRIQDNWIGCDLLNQLNYAEKVKRAH